MVKNSRLVRYEMKTEVYTLIFKTKDRLLKSQMNQSTVR